MNRKVKFHSRKTAYREVRGWPLDISIEVEASTMQSLSMGLTSKGMDHRSDITLIHKLGLLNKFTSRSLSFRNLLLVIDRSSLLVFCLPLIVYILTLAPTVYNLDSAELTTAAATGGITRATGYPLYLMLGYLWSRIPIGDVGYRMNLFSACCGALTIALLDRIMRKLSISPWARMGSMGLLAFSTHFWGLSLIAEVYTLHTALMAALILLLMRWNESPSTKRLALVGFVYGLSLAHHGATILLLPGMIWYIGFTIFRRSLPLTHWLPAIGTLFIGISFYLYLPLRYAAEPLFNYAGYYDSQGIFYPDHLNTIRGLWKYVTGSSFSSSMFAYSVAELPGEVSQYGMQLWRTFFAIGIGPGIFGMIRLLKRNRPYGGMLFLMFACNVFFFIDYRVIDKETMFLPTFMIWALWLGTGYEELFGCLHGFKQDRIELWSHRLLRGLICLSVLGAILWNWGLVAQIHQERGDLYGEKILQELEPNAIVIGYWQVVPIVQYLQFVEGQRLDVMAINRFLISAQDLNQLIQEQVYRRPIYIDYPPSDLGEELKVSQSDVIYRLETKGPLFSSGRGEVEGVHNPDDMQDLLKVK